MMKTFGIVQRLAPARRTSSSATPMLRTRPFAEAGQLAAPPAGAGFDFARVSVQPRPRPGGLPHPLRAAMERLSGVRLDDVRVHLGSRAPAEVDALAYTQGRDIHVAPGQEHHLAHEAWHVVQQKRGRVRPTVDVAGKPVNDDGALEREAQAMGERALRSAAPSAELAPSPTAAAPAAAATAPVQRGIDRTASNRRKAKTAAGKRKPSRRGASKLDPFARPKTITIRAPRGRYRLGQHGAKKSEQKRLIAAYKARVSGDTHESEHTIGFEPLNQTSGLKRGSPGRARDLENRAPAYQEVKELHREHIGTGTTGTVDASGFNSHTYRAAQRSLVESGDVSSAVQLNQLGYAHLTNPFGQRVFAKTPNTLQGKVANDSFNQMVGSLNSVTYAQGASDVTVPVDARQRAEIHLSRVAAQTGKFPTEEEENAVRKLYGLDEIQKKK